jgi:hypothetical protein
LGDLFGVSTLENPAAIVKIGKNLPGHLLARHLYNSSGPSRFSQKYSDPVLLLALIAYGVAHSVPKQVPNYPRLAVYEVGSFPETPTEN